MHYHGNIRLIEEAVFTLKDKLITAPVFLLEDNYKLWSLQNQLRGIPNSYPFALRGTKIQRASAEKINKALSIPDNQKITELFVKLGLLANVTEEGADILTSSGTHNFNFVTNGGRSFLDRLTGLTDIWKAHSQAQSNNTLYVSFRNVKIALSHGNPKSKIILTGNTRLSIRTSAIPLENAT